MGWLSLRSWLHFCAAVSFVAAAVVVVVRVVEPSSLIVNSPARSKQTS